MSHSAESFRRGILYCCSNFGYRKSLDKKGRYQDFRSKIFCLTVPKNFVGAAFTVASISVTEKVWRRGGGQQDFTSKIFCLTVPKVFVGESFTVAVISGTGKVWIRRGVSRFSVEICLTVPKNFVGEAFTVASISVTGKFWRRGGGGIKILRQNFLSQSAENFRRGIFYCCINFGYPKSLDKRGGGVSR